MRKTRLSLLDFPLRTMGSEFEYDVRFAVAREEMVSVHTTGMLVCICESNFINHSNQSFKLLTNKGVHAVTCVPSLLLSSQR